jgi:exodeoxyribonuclease V alpha subunit
VSYSRIYSSSDHCQQQLKGVEAIDYFMANQITIELEQKDNELLFHLLLALQGTLRQGHSCLPIEAVAEQQLWLDNKKEPTSGKQLAGYYFPSHKEISHYLDTLAIGVDDAAAIVFDTFSSDKKALYLRRYWQFETEVAIALQQRINFTPLTSKVVLDAKEIYSKLFPNAVSNQNNEADWQQVAVANSLGRRLSIISGGPGTGKTYTVTRLLACLQAVHKGQLKIIMAAPTGKAAQRLKESIAETKNNFFTAQGTQSMSREIINSIPEEASTLHRLLGFRPKSLQLKHDAKNPLNCDVLLIDEVSMIDLPMMARLLRAIPEQSSLILLGDANQLPSVETGCVLADISCQPHPGYTIEAVKQIYAISGQKVKENESSHYSHLTLLTQSRRFGGQIGEIAKEVINADANASWNRLIKHEQKNSRFDLSKKTQLTYLHNRLFDAWLSHACQFYFLKISQSNNLAEAFSALACFRILVPTRVGERGVIQLNQTIEQQLASKNKAVQVGKNYKGRPIMVIQNSYSSHLFNGDIGLLWPDNDGTDDKGKLVAWFEQSEGQYRQVSLARLPAIETVYAMTIHKTQGSEFEQVAIVLPLHTPENSLISPELLYTGLTRAKKQLSIIANEQVWKSALKNRTARYSGLKERLYNQG